jgi:hypothetical protein
MSNNVPGGTPRTVKIVQPDISRGVQSGGIGRCSTPRPASRTDEPSGESASWYLVHFIRHLPEISEPELQEMASLNPGPPEEVRQRMLEEQFLKGGAKPA